MAVTRPFTSFRFLVEVRGIVEGGFAEVTGLQSELETFDYREGGRNDFVHRLAGPVRYPTNLTLRRGIAAAELWNWFAKAASGHVVRGNVSVLLVDPEQDESWRWSFVDAYPVRWTGPELRASASTVAVEAVELAHRGLDLQESGPEAAGDGFG